jgi:hypothetical protein
MSLPIIQRGIIAAPGGASEFALGSAVAVADPGLSLPGLAVPANALLVVGIGTTGLISLGTTTAFWGATPLGGTAEYMNGSGLLTLQVLVRRTLVQETRTLTVQNLLDPSANLVFAIATYLIGPSFLNGEGSGGGAASPADLAVNLGASDWGACYVYANAALGDPGPWLAPARTLHLGADLRTDPNIPGFASEAFVGPGPLGVTHAQKTLNPPANGNWFGVWAALS